MDRKSTALKPLKVSDHCFSQLAEIRERVSTSLRPYRCQVYLFGSWATENAHPSSDVDIAILLEASLPTGFLNQLRFELEESSLLLSVDLIDLTQTPSTFQQCIMSEGELWIDSMND